MVHLYLVVGIGTFDIIFLDFNSNIQEWVLFGDSGFGGAYILSPFTESTLMKPFIVTACGFGEDCQTDKCGQDRLIRVDHNENSRR